MAIDKEAAKRSFNDNIDRLSRLPLITDREMDALFGEEVATVLRQLSVIDRQGNICSDCRDKCCRIIKCELYSARFDRCPIHELRPALCRLHYCEKFRPASGTLIKEIGDIFLDCLEEAQDSHNADVLWFDSPPLADGSPGLVRATSLLVKAVEDGGLEPEQARHLILAEAEKHRKPSV